MSDNLRFPSGLSVKQAREEAKKYAETHKLPLNVVKDMVAHRSGLRMGWDKAIVWLKKCAEPLATFQLSLYENQHHHVLEVYPQASTVLIIGASGVGKTMLALDFVIQHLKSSSSEIHWCSSYDLPAEDQIPENDLASQLLAQLAKQHSQRLHFHLLDDNQQPYVPATVPEGELVVVDEPCVGAELPAQMKQWMREATERRHVLVICAQTTEELFGTDTAPSEVGMILMSTPRETPNRPGVDASTLFFPALQRDPSIVSF